MFAAVCIKFKSLQEMSISDKSTSGAGKLVSRRLGEEGDFKFAELVNRLSLLSNNAATLSTSLGSEELKHRCSVLSIGASTAAELLVRFPAEIAAASKHWPDTGLALHDTNASAGAGGIGTKLLHEIGWLAMKLGLDTEALAILQAVGTLLHGRIGGSIFKIESLLAIGKFKEAATLYKSEILDTGELDPSTDAIFTSLWSQHGDFLWYGLKMQARAAE